MKKLVLQVTLLLGALLSACMAQAYQRQYTLGTNGTGPTIFINNYFFQFQYTGSNDSFNSQQEFAPYNNVVSEQYADRFNKFNWTSWEEDNLQNGVYKGSVTPNIQAFTATVSISNVDSPYTFNDVKNVSEHFIIDIPVSGVANFQADGYVSFLRALETFAQLVQDFGALGPLPIHIEDFPDLVWRGIMIDTARHFQPIPVIQRTIRGLQIAKLNVLHLHLTDSESFPVQLNNYSRITQYGAYSSDQIYSQEDLKALVTYAQERGVLLVPEIDQPAHSRSWSDAPDLSDLNACGDAPYANWTQYCYQPPCGQLNPTLNKTYEVAQSILTELQDIFSANYVHLGGDEYIPACWDFNTEIQQWMNSSGISNYSALFDYYFAQVNQFVEPGKTRIYWAAADLYNYTYLEGAIVQYWLDSDSGYDALQYIDNEIILSPYDSLYFDCGTGNLLGNEAWCDPWKPWWQVYNFNTSKPQLGSRLLGAEAPLWSEMIPPTALDYKTWPRAIALALRLWNTNEYLSKLEVATILINVSKHLESVGIAPGPTTVQYCEYHEDRCFFPGL